MLPDQPSPTVLSSRNLQSTLSHPSQHTVSWNDDGQCLVLTTKRIYVSTPYLATRRPKPIRPLDDRSIKSILKLQKKNPVKVEDQSDAPSQTKRARRSKRPAGGEIEWWTVEAQVNDFNRKEAFDNDVPSLCATIGGEGDPLRQAVWSPSGIAPSGGCLMCILTGSGRALIFAPDGDPQAEAWLEIEELALSSRDSASPSSSPPEEKMDPQEDDVLESRSTCIAWSKHIPSTDMMGVDGSVIAVANRSGSIALWTYAAQKTSTQLDYLRMCPVGSWSTQMAWSEWTPLDEDTYKSRLAFCVSDGSIKTIDVTRTAKAGRSNRKSWEFQRDDITTLDHGDGRVITSLKWINNVLVWTKAGTVHMLADDESRNISWRGFRSFGLARIGHWAGASPYSQVISIELLNPTTLLVVQSSLSTHLIQSFDSSPALVPITESLQVALDARRISLENLDTVPAPQLDGCDGLEEDGWTTHTSGWARVGDWGKSMIWATELTSFQTLHIESEAHRYVHLIMAEICASTVSDEAFTQALKRTLWNPRVLVHISPQYVLMPFMLHMLTSSPSDTLAADVQELVLLCLQRTAEYDSALASQNIVVGLWNNSSLNSLRLCLVLAIWCSSIFDQSTTEFQLLVSKLSKKIRSYLITLKLAWLSITIDTHTSLGPFDRRFIARLIKLVQEPSDPSGISAPADTIQSSARSLSTLLNWDQDSEASADERCPICMAEGEDGGVCKNGHSMPERCSLTDLPITSEAPRVCSICLAPAFMNHSSGDPMTQHGVNRPTHQDTVVQMVLDSAIGCAICGGRWITKSKRRALE
ncbi:hypothetical protein B9479_003573 [Cryptococcus floricola]|uniref:Transcription factor IIIC 90kDa subunit N-terminal domain-containing protein n=1 Tax=Cryptococcus floricola TaxID=2591691 RepID=A0A5D3B043_9TREE|nr:hypothetical protein B9479_003573 [Cryptococcus floricola]